MPGFEEKSLLDAASRRFESVSTAYAIAIPARNEQERISACLDACARSIQAAGQDGAIVLLVNNSTDGTADRALAWARGKDVDIEIVDLDLPAEESHAGGARRRALQLARRRIAPSGALLTTDADSLPTRDWVGASLAGLRDGASLVCGQVELDRDELARLPARLLAMGVVEDRYRAAARELSARIDPDPANPWPHHGQASGASLAIAARAYDAIGGAPLVPVGEDRALVRLAIEHDLIVRYCDEAKVVTSCRLNGRATGGMADTIASRLDADDYICDEALEPAERTLVRATMRADLRRLHRLGAAPSHLLRRAGLDEAQRREALAQKTFGALWHVVERHSPLLRREPFYWSRMESELPGLLDLLAQATLRSPAPSAIQAAAS